MYIDEKTAQRLKKENKTRAPIIKKITDALPMFKPEDFDSWTTARIEGLADRVERGNVKFIDDVYARVGAKGGE